MLRVLFHSDMSLRHPPRLSPPSRRLFRPSHGQNGGMALRSVRTTNGEIVESESRLCLPNGKLFGMLKSSIPLQILFYTVQRLTQKAFHFYLPREFNSIIMIAVCMPPRADGAARRGQHTSDGVAMPLPL